MHLRAFNRALVSNVETHEETHEEAQARLG
jgi:hypothetical protein